MNIYATPVEARLRHLAWWVLFGATAGGVWSSFLAGPSLPALAGVMAFGFLIVIAVGGLVRTWDLMTENE